MSLAPLATRLRRLSPASRDLAVTVVVGVPAIAFLVKRSEAHDRPWYLAVALLAIPAIYLRGRRPFLALAMAAAAVALVPAPETTTLMLPGLVVLYTIGSTRGVAAAILGALGFGTVAIISGGVWGGADSGAAGGMVGLILGTAAFCAAAVALGLYVGAQRRVLAGLRERAERSEREHELLADRAVAEERVRIAQELHDVVAHDISLMVVQAQALGATAVDERVTETTDAIADLGRDAMAEMHRTLRLLRGGSRESAELEPLPGLADLDSLLARLRGAGLEITLLTEGEPHPLCQAADLSAYRVIQEALTNVIKHAESAPTTISLRYDEAALQVTVRDVGAKGNGSARRRRADGHGITGMRERVALFGGTLATAALAGEGFEVTATLPYGEAGA